MNRAILYLTAGAFGLGIVVTLAAVFVFINAGSSAASTLPAVVVLEPEVSGSGESKIAQSLTERATDRNDGNLPEGIKVHGRWTIEVTEPDGTLVSRREFDNALLGTGGWRIADILARQVLPRYWGVRLRHTLLSESPCIGSTGAATSCIVYEPNGINASFTSNNLEVTADSSGVLTLSGSIAAQRDGQVTSVTTLHNGRPCAEGADFPDDCAGSAGTEITRTTISPAINVSEGQVMAVTVEISFE